MDRSTETGLKLPVVNQSQTFLRKGRSQTVPPTLPG